MLKSTGDFNNQRYALGIVGKNVEVTPAIREHIEGKIGKLEPLIPDIIDVKVYLGIQKLHHSVDIFVKFSHFRVNVRAVTENMYGSLDKAFERLSTKFLKWKSRIQDHHARKLSVKEMEVNILEQSQNEESEGEFERDAQKYALPKVVKKKKRPLKVLTLEEAVMKMELSDDHFKIYRSEEDQRLKVIYRRRDGSYGVISPE